MTTEYQDLDEDLRRESERRIRCNSGWGGWPNWRDADGRGLPHTHQSAAGVKECYRKARTPGGFPCTWHVPHYTEDGRGERECGALSKMTEDGYECEAGHTHVDAEIMDRRGQAYASDDAEAERLIKAGMTPLNMDGSFWRAP